MGIDVAAWWRPTAANYFGRIKKSALLDAMTTIGGPELAGRYASAKKVDLADAAEKLCSGKTIVEAHVRIAALAWLPPVMTFGTVDAEIVTDDDNGPEANDDAEADGDEGEDKGVDLEEAA